MSQNIRRIRVQHKNLEHWTFNDQLYLAKTSSDFLIIQCTVGNFVTYSVPVTHNLWFVHTIQSCFLCLKVRFQQENVSKGGIFQGRSCVFGRKSIDIIVQSWFFKVQIKFNLFHWQSMVWDGHGLLLWWPQFWIVQFRWWRD